MRPLAAWAAALRLALGLALGLAWAEPRGMPYLPPPSREQAPLAANGSTQLLNRFGDDGIYFAPGDADGLRPLAQIELEVQRDVGRGVAKLALGLQRWLGADASSARDNIVFSPVSVYAVMMLAKLGSGGLTFDELSQALGLTASGAALTPERDNAIHQHFGHLLSSLTRRAAATDSSEAVAAQGVFVQLGLPLRRRFEQVARQAYHSDVQTLDFLRRPLEAQAAVNEWVSRKTRGRIMDILAQPPPPATRLILGSALYFNGQWQQPFPGETTQRRPFYVDGDDSGEVLQVEMMATSAELPYAEDAPLGCKVLQLPYKGGDVAMYVVLPHARGVRALRALEAGLTLEDLERLVASVRLEPDVIVLLPRTKLDYGANLRGPLQRQGVRALFDAGAANLSLLAGFDDDEGAAGARGLSRADDPLFVDEVLHKVEVDITEMGTVASAATLATVTRDGSHRSVRADRPFLFFIRHQPTGLLLFWGSVVRPRPTPPIV